jgi:hypothetical protein
LWLGRRQERLLREGRAAIAPDPPAPLMPQPGAAEI